MKGLVLFSVLLAGNWMAVCFLRHKVNGIYFQCVKPGVALSSSLLPRV